MSIMATFLEMKRQSSKQFTFSKQALTRIYLNDCAKPGNFAIIMLFFFSLHNKLLRTIQLSFFSFLQTQLLYSCWILTSSHTQRYSPKKKFIMSHTNMEIVKIVIKLLSFLQTTILLSQQPLKIVKDGGPNIALGQASAILLTSKGMHLPCEISFV